MKPRAVVSWSGGKDCCLAFHRVRGQFDIVGLITMMTEDGQRSRSHGLRPDLLQEQARLMGVPHFTQAAAWMDYDDAFSRLLSRVRVLGVTHVIFGDIYPDANRIWAENISADQGLTAVEPLWDEPTDRLVHEFISTQSAALITTVQDAYLDDTYLGRSLTRELVQALVQKGIDPCGERGEF
ncbi:MAG: adenosine nucleotide hydrolase, partial [Terriglobia bacterium]